MEAVKKALSRPMGVLCAGYAAVAVLIAAPYYNYRYAQEHGVMVWLAGGQLAPSIQAFGWPYHAYLASSKYLSQGTPAPTANEAAAITDVIGAAAERLLTEADLKRLDAAVGAQAERSGMYGKPAELEGFRKVLHLDARFHAEVEKSALASFRAHRKVTTPAFDSLYPGMVKTRDKASLQQDLDLIEAAGRHDAMVPGTQVALTEAVFTSRILSDAALEANLDKLMAVFMKYTRP